MSLGKAEGILADRIFDRLSNEAFNYVSYSCSLCAEGQSRCLAGSVDDIFFYFRNLGRKKVSYMLLKHCSFHMHYVYKTSHFVCSVSYGSTKYEITLFAFPS